MSMQHRAGTTEKQRRLHPVHGESSLLTSTPLECDFSVIIINAVYSYYKKQYIPPPIDSEVSHEVCFDLGS